MANFDFITDSDLRTSLNEDYKELNACINCEAWKAVHVLAGSIIEAVLTDTLIVSEYKTKTGIDPLRMDLGKIIGACKDEGYLSQKAVDLCTVIRNYRNLIHPGRLVRFGEDVNEEGAIVGKSLVEIITREVSSKRKQTYGFTAEEIVTKLRSDRYAIGILSHLVKSTNTIEIKRLLLYVLPEQYSLLDPFGQDEQQERSLCLGFRTVLDAAPDEIKKSVAQKFVTLLKEGKGYELSVYTEAFFKAKDMAYMSLSIRT